MTAAAGPRPRVDVGVVTYNTAELTASALRRMLDSDQGAEIRVLVHDNASADGTPDLLARAVPEAEVEVAERNLGFARAVNRLVERSDAPWFLMLNADAWPEPGAVGRLVARARLQPRAAVVAPLVRRPGGEVEHTTHPFPSLALGAVEATGGRRWLSRRRREALCLEGAWRHDRPRAVDWAVGAAWLVPRAAWEALGGLDERFFMYVEDLAWCWRATRRGWEVWFEPEAVVRHVGGASGSKRWGDRRLALEAAHLRTFLAEALGPRRAALYRGLEAGACAGRWALARRRGDIDAAGYWRMAARAHAGLLAPPPVDDEPARSDPAGDGGRALGGPVVSVVVPTRGRPERLGRLVAALEAQTLPTAALEVVVVDDASPDDTPEVLDKLAADSALDLTVLHRPERRGPAAARNVGWRAASAPVVAFTDDDCVPEPGWLAAGLAALGTGRRAVVGRVLPPDDQLGRADEPFARVLRVESTRFFEACNVFYRRGDLEAVGGFDERFRRPSGEDTHLGLRMVERGVEPVFCPGATVRHDVRPGDLGAALREATRWADLPLVLAGRPSARPALVHRLVFWKPTHPPAIAAAAGLVAAARWRPALLLAAPWVVHRLRTDPVCPDPARRLATLPGALALDLCEVATMVRGSVRHKTVLL